MGYSADFHDAHLRHWDDAECLFEDSRWANADQLYGLSAECGLKAVMLGLGMPVGRYGEPTQPKYKQHVNILWPTFRTFVSGRNGIQYLNLLPPSNPFTRWSITDRYASGHHFTSTGVNRHRMAACKVIRMVQQVKRDGIL